MIKNVVRYQDPTQWGVLCVDVWNVNGKNDDFYQRAVNELKNFNVKCVVNCTTDIKIDYSDLSVFNTFKNYQWQPLFNFNEANQRVMLDLIKSSGKQESSNILKTQLFGDHTIHLSNPITFTHHVDLFYPEVKNWIVLGGSWKIHLHYGPLGFDKLLGIPSASFNIFPEWSIQKEDRTNPTIDDLEDDQFVWGEIPNKGYRLVTQVGGKWQR